MAAFWSVQSEDPQLTQEQLEAQARSDYRWLMEDPRGRRVARTVLRWSGIDDTGSIEGEAAMAFDAGKRVIGNLLKAQIRKHNPEGWVQLESEHVRELTAAAERDRRGIREQAQELMKAGAS